MKKVINIQWEGPIPLKETIDCNHDGDYGLYQIYGSHPVYGSNTLIYIGQASMQPFGKSIFQQGWQYHYNISSLSVYVGRLVNESTLSGEQWVNQVENVYKLFVYAHSPAYNSKFVNNYHKDDDIRMLHVINWHNYRDLLSEVSGERWASGFGVAIDKN